MLLSLVTAALALTCEEIVAMVEVNVPERIIVDTIAGAGITPVAPDFLACLSARHAPPAVIAAAGNTSVVSQTYPAGSAAVVPEVPPAAPPPAGRPVVADPLHASPDDPFAVAQALDSLGLSSAAQEFYSEVLKRGPESPEFATSLERLVVLAFEAGDTSDLLRLVAKIPPDEYPLSIKNELYYLLGLNLCESELTAKCKQYMEQVTEDSPLYPRAKLIEGVVYEVQGREKSGVRAFQEVIDRSDDPALVTAARLNIARVYYSIERYEDATIRYQAIPGDPHAILEGAWAALMLHDHQDPDSMALYEDWSSNLYSRDILPDLRPLREAWLPESFYLEGVALLEAERYAEVEPLYAAWQARWGSVEAELRATVEAYSSTEARRRGEELYRRYLGEDAEGCLPSAFLSTLLLRDRELAGIHGRLPGIHQERVRVARMEADWKVPVATALEALEGKLERRAGVLLLQQMVRRVYEVRRASSGLRAIRFFAARALHLPEAPARFEELAAADPGPEVETLRVAIFSTDPVAGYQGVVAKWPDYEEAWLKLGISLWELGREDEAVTAFSRVRNYPWQADAQRFVGTYWFYRKHWKEAEYAFQVAGDDYMLAWTRWALGDKAGAVRTMRRATGEQAAADLRRFEAAAREEGIVVPR